MTSFHISLNKKQLSLNKSFNSKKPFSLGKTYSSEVNLLHRCKGILITLFRVNTYRAFCNEKCMKYSRIRHFHHFFCFWLVSIYVYLII